MFLSTIHINAAKNFIFKGLHKEPLGLCALEHGTYQGYQPSPSWLEESSIDRFIAPCIALGGCSRIRPGFQPDPVLRVWKLHGSH